QRQEELLEPLAVDARGLLALGEAALEAGGDDREAGPVEGLGGGGELGDDVGAVGAALEHLDDAPDLPLGAAQAVDDGGHLRGVELHAVLPRRVGPSYPPGYVSRYCRAVDLDPHWLRDTVARALDEDLGGPPGRDLTTEATVPADAT